MALEKTDWYFDYREDPQLTRRLSRNQLRRIGSGSGDDVAWAKGYAHLWLVDPPNPYTYGRKIVGTPTLNTPMQRAEQINSWEELGASEKRSLLQDVVASQVPVVSITDTIRDHTAQAKIEQIVERAKVAERQLLLTDDADLDDFDSDINHYEIQETDYARNIAAQEQRNLDIHRGLVASGNGGIYAASDVSEMESRIVWNADVSRGTQTGVKTPAAGAQRGDVALDKEEVRQAAFTEIQFDWASQTYFIPSYVLDSIPDGVDPNFVYAMTYDGDNVYRGWMPFVQQPDGTWRTPSDANYVGVSQQSSSRWRCAIAHGGTGPEFEITRRVYLVPPNVAGSPVRWGGRNGPVEA